MTVTTLMPVRNLNLVAPLPHKGTDMHITDTAAPAQDASAALAPSLCSESTAAGPGRVEGHG